MNGTTITTSIEGAAAGETDSAARRLASSATPSHRSSVNGHDPDAPDGLDEALAWPQNVVGGDEARWPMRSGGIAPWARVARTATEGEQSCRRTTQRSTTHWRRGVRVLRRLLTDAALALGAYVRETSEPVEKVGGAERFVGS